MNALISNMRIAALVGIAALAGACSPPAEQNAQNAGAPAAAPDPAPATGPKPSGGMVMQTVIVISNSGSTNTIGYRISIGAAGDTSYVSGDGPGRATLAADLYAKLKADIAAAGPLSQMPMAVGCVKSASFGTTTTVAMGGEVSPDLSCAGSEASKALKDDVDAVIAVLKLRNVPRNQGNDLPPQNQ